MLVRSGIIYVADANHLEQSLGLFAEVTGLGKPCVLVLNKMDEVRDRDEDIDTVLLDKRLGIPVVECCAHCKKDVFNITALIQHGEIAIPTEPFIEPMLEEFNKEIIQQYDDAKQKRVDNSLKEVGHSNRDNTVPLTKFDRPATHP